MINKKNLGYLNLDGFMARDEIEKNLHKHLKLAFVGGGQAGGKISAEFLRLGYYANMYNTCNEDLEGIEETLENCKEINYNKIKLEGCDGASKDRKIGKKAIEDNIDLIKEKLIGDQELINADFVWLILGLGGGTGCGSVATVSQILSGIMRKNKRYMGKPTFGVILAIPEQDAKQKQKLNAAQALREIQQLQAKGLIGAALIIDNEKLINDFLKSDDNFKDWTTYGNTTVAKLITEIAAITCLPGRETLDKSEVLDIWTTPGFLTIGKLTTGKLEEENTDELIKKSFEESNIFAEDYNYNTALHGGMAVILPKVSKGFGVKDSIKLKRSMNKFLDGSLVEVTHFGVFENDMYGSYQDPKIIKDGDGKGIIYTLAVTKELPKNILEMTKEALEKEEQRLARLKQGQDDELGSLLNSLSLNIDTEKKQDDIQELSLEDILGGSLLDDDTNIQEKLIEENDEFNYQYDPTDILFKK